MLSLPGKPRTSSESARPGTARPGRLTRHADQPVRPLPAAGHVHDAAVLVEGQVIPLVALEPVQRQVVIAARDGQVRELVRLLRVAEPAPGAIAEVKHAVRMTQTADDRRGSFKGVV